MAAKRGRVEIIEVLPADEARPADAYGVAPPPDVAGPDKPRRWWIAPLALAGIAAVVVGAGVLSDGSSSNGDPAGRSGDTELRADADVAPAVLPLVPATPPGYRIAGVVQSSGAPADGRRPARQLWATHPDASLLSSWVEITASPTVLTTTAAGDRRVAVPGGTAVLDTKPDGNIRIIGPLSGGGEAEIDSSGVSRSTLIELLGSLRFDGEALRSTDDRLGGMFQPVAADDGAPLTAGASLEVSYQAITPLPNNRDDFTVRVGSLGSPYDETARRFFLSRRTEVIVNAQQALIGSDERSFGVQSISFERAGLLVRVTGTAPRPMLIDAAQSTHVATGAELATLLAMGPPPPPTTPSADDAVLLTSGRLSTGSFRVELVAGATDGSVQIILSSGGVVRDATLIPNDSYIATVASPTMTALVAFIAPGVDGAQLVVDIGDPAAPTTITATPIELPSGIRVAALAFDQMDPYEAAIHTADGGTLSVAVG